MSLGRRLAGLARAVAGIADVAGLLQHDAGVGDLVRELGGVGEHGLELLVVEALEEHARDLAGSDLVVPDAALLHGLLLLGDEGVDEGVEGVADLLALHLLDRLLVEGARLRAEGGLGGGARGGDLGRLDRIAPLIHRAELVDGAQLREVHHEGLRGRGLHEALDAQAARRDEGRPHGGEEPRNGGRKRLRGGNRLVGQRLGRHGLDELDGLRQVRVLRQRAPLRPAHLQAAALVEAGAADEAHRGLLPHLLACVVRDRAGVEDLHPRALLARVHEGAAVGAVVVAVAGVRARARRIQLGRGELRVGEVEGERHCCGLAVARGGLIKRGPHHFNFYAPFI